MSRQVLRTLHTSDHRIARLTATSQGFEIALADRWVIIPKDVARPIALAVLAASAPKDARTISPLIKAAHKVVEAYHGAGGTTLADAIDELDQAACIEPAFGHLDARARATPAPAVDAPTTSTAIAAETDLPTDRYGMTVLDRIRDTAENGTMPPEDRKDLFALLDLAAAPKAASIPDDVREDIVCVRETVTDDQWERLWVSLHGLKCNPVMDEITLVMQEVVAILCAPKAASAPAVDAVPAGEVKACSFADCPPGLFRWNGLLCFKSEYSTKAGQPDAYCVDSGEYFWGGTSGDLEKRRNLMVQPVASASLSHGEGRK